MPSSLPKGVVEVYIIDTFKGRPDEMGEEWRVTLIYLQELLEHKYQHPLGEVKGLSLHEPKANCGQVASIVRNHQYLEYFLFNIKASPV